MIQDQIEHAKRVKNEVKREHDDVDSDDEPEIIRQALVKRVRHSTKDDPIELSDDD